MFDFGFIGTGNMGSALAKGISKKTGGKGIAVSDKISEKAEKLAAEIGAEAVSVKTLAENSRYIFLGVKPQFLSALTEEIAPVLSERKDRFIVVSMLAGTSAEKVAKMLGDCPVIRIMPNVACLVGEGMTLCARNEKVKDEEYEFFFSAMEKTGKLDSIDEKLIDAASALSGCGPAYVFMMAEALADGAVDCGVPRDKAYLYAAQTLKGSAALLLETDKGPSELKDSVCSPGGTTIEGVRALEKGAFRSDIIEAVRAAYDKTLKLGK